MQEIKAIVPAKEKWISIAWQVNDFCNFRCSYCNEGNWGGNFKNENVDEILANFEKILDFYLDNGYKYFKLFLSGGEPTHWPGLVPLIELFKRKLPWEGNCVGINTNLSRPLSWWKDHYHYFNDIVASYHADFTKDERYMENYIFLMDKVNYLCSRIMMHKEKFQQCIDISDRIKRECFNYVIEYAPVFDELRPTTEPYHYDEQWQIDFLKNNSYERQTKKWILDNVNYAYSRMILEDGTNLPIESNTIIVDGKNYFKGWTCNIHESLHIYPHGDIRQASCGVGKLVGNIRAGTFDVKNSKAVICPKDHCHCAADINITKYRP